MEVKSERKMRSREWKEGILEEISEGCERQNEMHQSIRRKRGIGGRKGVCAEG